MEILVVVIILAVMAALVAPRLAAMTTVRVRPYAEQAADLLSTAARRDQLTSQRVAVEYDAETAALRMLVLKPASDGKAVEWAADLLSPEVHLGETRVVSARADGVEQEPKQWRIEFSGATKLRPTVTLLIAGPGGRDPWTVQLTPESARARVYSGWPQKQLTGGGIELDEQQAW